MRYCLFLHHHTRDIHEKHEGTFASLRLIYDTLFDENREPVAEWDDEGGVWWADGRTWSDIEIVAAAEETDTSDSSDRGSDEVTVTMTRKQAAIAAAVLGGCTGNSKDGMTAYLTLQEAAGNRIANLARQYVTRRGETHVAIFDADPMSLAEARQHATEIAGNADDEDTQRALQTLLEATA